MTHPWKHSRSSWTGLWTNWSSRVERTSRGNVQYLKLNIMWLRETVLITLCFQLGGNRSRTCTDKLLISRSDYKVTIKTINPFSSGIKKTLTNKQKSKQKPLLGLRDPYKKTALPSIFKGLLMFSSKAVV